MPNAITTRRRVLGHLLAGSAMAALLPRGAAWAAEEPITISWPDLRPEDDAAGVLMEQLRGSGVVQHGELSTGFTQTTAAALTTEYNGKRVRLPGYAVPLDYSSGGMTAFILAPFVGACIHVPPPPPNQLVFVTTEIPFESDGLYQPVWVTGTFQTMATGTELAEIGYAMTADHIEPYG